MIGKLHVNKIDAIPEHGSTSCNINLPKLRGIPTGLQLGPGTTAVAPVKRRNPVKWLRSGCEFFFLLRSIYQNLPLGEDLLFYLDKDADDCNASANPMDLPSSSSFGSDWLDSPGQRSPRTITPVQSWFMFVHGVCLAIQTYSNHSPPKFHGFETLFLVLHGFFRCLPHRSLPVTNDSLRDRRAPQIRGLWGGDRSAKDRVEYTRHK